MEVYLKLNVGGTYVDYTDYVDISSLKRNISLNAQNDPQRSQTGDIEVYGSAYSFVKTNLIDSVNLYSNSIFVKIIDTDCSSYEMIFKINNNNLRWCDNNECRMRFSMEEYNEVLDCIKTTLIADNTNGEFQDYPTSGMPHPRFRYCDVFKPNGMFGAWVTIMNALDLVVATMTPIVNSLNALLTLASLPNITWGGTFFDKWGGCERGHPAPYIRTYIDNVCYLCGLGVDETTDPIFHDEYDPFAPAFYNQYYNACLLTAYTTKGVDMNGNKDYIPNNKPSWTLFDLMSKIKGIWNGRWYIHGNKLYFHRRDLLSGLMYTGYGIDLSGSDAEKLQGHVCYEWNGEGKMKRINLNYSTDPIDSIGNELLKRFNGEYIDTSGNPNYTANIEETFLEFGASSFVLDGQDTLYDANVEKAVGSVLSGITYGGSLKTQGDTLGFAKILIHEVGSGNTDARSVKNSWSLYGCAEFADDQGGFFPISASDLYNYNYPMSLSPCQDPISPTGNLWQYWQIETPDPAKKTNISFNFKMDYCCAYNSLDLYMKVLFEDGVTEGIITSIDYEYSIRSIIIKGNLL